MNSSYLKKKKTITALVIFSLLIDGFCLGYLLTFYNEPRHKNKKTAHVAKKTSPAPFTLTIATLTKIESETTKVLATKRAPSQVTPAVVPVVVPKINSRESWVKQEESNAKVEDQYNLQKNAQIIPKTNQFDAEYLEKLAKQQSPKSTLVMPMAPIKEKVSPLLPWPRTEVEVGPSAGRDSFTSNIGPYSITNSNLVGGSGYYLRGQMALNPRTVIEGRYQSTSGNLSDSSVVNKTFSSSQATLGGRYRLFPNPRSGYCYYLGLAGQLVNDYRFSYLSSTSTSVVNYPFTSEILKLSGGLEFNSYYLFKGRMELNLYRTMASSLNISDGAHYSLDASLAHVVSGDLYVGLGLQYIVQAYGFVTNELGPTYQGTVNQAKLDALLFLGIEL